MPTLPAHVTEEFLYGLAPDGKVAKAGKELADGGWREPRISPDGTWLSAEFQGSDRVPYRLAVDLIDPKRPVALCSCPSYKRPCKHALGLVFLALRAPGRFEEGEPPADLKRQREQFYGDRPAKPPPPPRERKQKDPRDVGEALLRDLREQPDDEAARLIYADWLQENGETPKERERGEFIHLQYSLQHLAPDAPACAELKAREAKLWKKYRTAWLAGVPKHLRRQDLVFHRGFLEELPLTAANLRRHGETIFEKYPTITRLRLTGAVDIHDAGRLAVMPYLKRVTSLSLERLAEAGARFFDVLLSGPYMANVTALYLGRTGLTSQNLTALLGLAHMSRLTALTLDHNAIGDGGARTLAQCERLAGLRLLDLSGNNIGPAGAKALAGSPHLGNLTALNLADNPWGAGGEAALKDRFGDVVRLV
jgi:uncharacterized protein (TIGR02996 family)